MKKIIVLIWIEFFLSIALTTSSFALEAPTLSISTSGLEVTAFWSSVSSATGYTLHYTPQPYTPGQTIYSADMGISTQYSVTLTEGASYYVAITASDGTSASGYSNIESFTIENSDPSSSTVQPDLSEYTNITLSSSAYNNGEKIPLNYSCDGYNISPPLSWNSGPDGTKSYTLIMDDPDAQSVAGYTWVHWNIFNIPANLNNLDENSSDNGATNGFNDNGFIGYSGPCPPSSTFDHTYNLKIYAMNSILDPAPSEPLTQDEFENQFGTNILDRSEVLRGTFGR